MSRTTISKPVNADPERIWALLEDFGDVSWIPIDLKVEVHGDGVGMSRVIHGTAPTPVTETLTGMDPAARSLTYTLQSEAMPFPVTSYAATATVSGAAGQATLTWDVEFDPVDDEKAAVEAIDFTYGLMAGWLEASATTP